jgi:hypothetical protein
MAHSGLLPGLYFGLLLSSRGVHMCRQVSMMNLWLCAPRFSLLGSSVILPTSINAEGARCSWLSDSCSPSGLKHSGILILLCLVLVGSSSGMCGMVCIRIHGMFRQLVIYSHWFVILCFIDLLKHVYSEPRHILTPTPLVIQ